MKKKILAAGLVLAAFVGSLSVQAEKKQLEHSDLDAWNTLKNIALTRDGRWSTFTINPLQGDGKLFLRDTQTGKEIVVERGYKPQFTADGQWAVVAIKPLFADTRKAKIAKKKGDELPQDSLAIINLKTGIIEKFANVQNFALGKDGGNWMAFTSIDTLYIKAKALKDKEAGRPLIVRHLPTGKQKVVKNVKSYSFATDGSRVAMSLKKSEKDSVATDGIALLTLADTTFTLIDRDKLHYGAPVFNEAGTALAFVADNDSVKTGTRRATMYLSDLSMHANEPESIPSMVKLPRELFVNQYTKPLFSHDGKRLIVGLAPYIAPDDTTIVDFERADLDIWRWDAPKTPPQELKGVDKQREKTFPYVYDIAAKSGVLITDKDAVVIRESDRWDSDWVMLRDPSGHEIEQQWDYTSPEKIIVKNAKTGEEKVITTTYRDNAVISPKGRFVAWYDNRQIHACNIATGDSVCITESIPYPIWDEADDHPMMPEPYGIAFWTENDNDIAIYDKHDIWLLDPTGKRAPKNLTNGRDKNLRFRYIETKEDEKFVKPAEEILLSVFSFDDKRNGLSTLRLGKDKQPKINVLDTYQFTQVQKAQNAPVFTFSKQNFHTSPDLYVAVNEDFAKAKKVSDVNPQMKDYRWGKAELVKWRAFDGREVEGVIYIPDDIDPTQKYPMLSVFYETASDHLYRHYQMEPSWSWVNYPFYVSRGYVIFVPDIHYTPGLPGESAYNCVVSGCEEMCRRYSFIDPERIGIDGQSWGGYQTAFLITRTNMFACAGSGAPVANMTSAFGGIRWATGDSRQAQYEQGQSRIGKNIWEAPELYIANSPLFRLNKVETPLLIMHNDADGAVPWYQGIELFMGLRRLGKPVWMLQYNGESHNLRQLKNCKDITIRLQQFFDYYLKGAPMPTWMRDGVPAIRKGQELGY